MDSLADVLRHIPKWLKSSVEKLSDNSRRVPFRSSGSGLEGAGSAVSAPFVPPKAASQGRQSDLSGSFWKRYSAKFVRGVWLVRSRVGMSYRARRPVFPPSWAAGLFRAPLRPRARRNGPKVAWTEPRAPETMRNGGGPAGLGGGDTGRPPDRGMRSPEEDG